ncbi:MAG: hypothetical protein O3C40_23925 [Planctomycetota bacterium]|nr:hypothetical protein [Planctomycetota bacterium]
MILATNGSGLFQPSDSSQWLADQPPYVEIDAGTERLQSTKDIDSLERKARIYEQH